MAIFSDRSHFERRFSPLWSLLARYQKRGKKWIDLTESNPTRCGFTYPPEWLRSLTKKENLCYDPDPKGSLEARRGVVAYYETHGVRVNPEQIILTASTSEAYQFLFFLLLNPGDRLHVPAPGYPLIEPLSKLNGISIDHFPIRYDGIQWKMDISFLEKTMKGGSGAIALVHPHNPTGSYIDRQDQACLIELAKRWTYPIIADEVFFDYRYPDQNPLPRSFTSQNRTLVFTLCGLSKLAGLPQMKLSWIVVSGPRKIAQEAVWRLEQIADSYLSVNGPAQNGVGLILRGRLKIQSQIQDRIWNNRVYLSEAMKRNLPEGNLLNSEGGWYATIRLPRVMTDEEWAILLLKEEEVLIYPGHLFDFTLESCLILSLLPPEAQFQRGVRKMVDRIAYSLSIIG